MSTSQKEVVLRRQNYRCAVCDKQLRPLGPRPPVFEPRAPWAPEGPSTTDDTQALCPSCHAIQTKKDRFRIAEQMKHVRAIEPKIDEYTPALSVFRAVTWEKPMPIPPPRNFYWDIFVHNSGPGAATEVDLKVFDGEGEQVASSTTPLLKKGEEVRLRAVYDLLNSKSWKVKVSYSDVRNRKYRSLELSLDYGSITSVASNIAGLPSR